MCVRVVGVQVITLETKTIWRQFCFVSIIVVVVVATMLLLLLLLLLVCIALQCHLVPWALPVHAADVCFQFSFPSIFIFCPSAIAFVVIAVVVAPALLTSRCCNSLLSSE